MKFTYINKKIGRELFTAAKHMDRYADKRFRSLLFSGTMSTVASFVSLLIGNLVAGNLLGENALTAITLVSPMISLLVFIATINSIGVSISMAIESGRGDRDRAGAFFSQGLLCAGALGILLAAGCILLRGTALKLLGVDERFFAQAKAYYNGLVPYMIVLPLDSLLMLTLIVESDIKRLNGAIFSQIGSNILLSVLLCKWLGIGGIGLALGASTFINTLVMCGHFHHGRSMVRFCFHFSWRDARQIVKFSLNDAGGMLFLTLFTAVMNRFLLAKFGEAAIVAFTVILNLTSLVALGFDGIGQAMQPLISAYFGERNPLGEKETMRVGLNAALIESALVTAALLALGGVIPGAYGIVTGETVKMAAVAVRLYALSMVPASLNMLWNSYLTYTDHVVLSVVNTVLRSLILRVVCMISFGMTMGLTGVWAGALAAELLTMLVTGLCVHRVAKNSGGRLDMPLLFDKEACEKIRYFPFVACTEDVMRIRDEAEADMIRQGISKKACFKVMMIIEEYGMAICERNEGRRTLAELYLFYGPSIRLTMRDDGAPSDVTQSENAAGQGVNAARMMILQHSGSSRYQLAVGDNRTTFEIPY